MAGKIIADTLEHSTAGSLDTQYVVNGSAKAFCSTNAAGTTINGSLNVSSLTDTDTGKQTVNLTSATADTNYAVICGVGNKDDADARAMMIRSVTASSYLTNVYNTASSLFDDQPVCSTIHGDLA